MPSRRHETNVFHRLWPGKYIGKSSVLRDYTPSQAVEFVKRLNDTMAAA